MNHFSNKNLLLKIKSGNKRAENEALQLIYQRELPRLYEYYRKSGLTYEYLQDIFQDALSTLYQQVTNGTFREETSISNYMKVLSRNIWCNHQRKIKKVQLIRTQAIDTSEQPFTLSESKTSKYPMSHLIERLTPDCQKILISFYYDNYNMADITKAFSLKNEQSARNKKCKCLKKLSVICNSLKLNQEDIII